VSRSLKKGPYVDAKLEKKIDEMNKSDKKTAIKTWKRASTITPAMIGHTIYIHSGNTHVPIFIQDIMVGHKLGEFTRNRKYKGHGDTEKKSKVR
jgi:small subunit ribosomal protein S19